MPARFKRRESIRTGFRRIAAEELDGILASLAGSDGPPDIHTARRHCKLTRALLRLVRGGLDDADFRRENTRLRDLARSLSAARDAQMRLRTFEQMLSLPGAPRFQPYTPLHNWLHAQAAHARAEILTPHALTHARSAVRRAQGRIAHLPLQTAGWRLLEPGLRRSYRAARRAFRHAIDAPSDAAHHEWRKRVKTLWHHIRFIRGAHPRKLGALAEQLDALGELLGDDHDLAVLQAHLATPTSPRIPLKNFALLDALIVHRRDSLLRVAQKLGVLACGEKPCAFLRRAHDWWHAWRK